MDRARRMVRLAVLLVVAGCLAPASALAGTYSWSQPGDFTTNAAATGQWSYVDSATAATVPPPSATGPMQSLNATSGGWQDPGGDSALVQDGSSALVIQPASDRAAGIGWTSPFHEQKTVAVTGTFQPVSSSGLCTSAPNWTLWVASQSSSAPAPSTSPTIASTLTVAPGDTVYLTVSYTGLDATNCAAANVTLAVSVPSTAPAPTITSPTPGQTFNDGSPTFSGTASDDYGAGSTVSVALYPGTSPTGTPAQTLSAPRQGTAFSVQAASALPAGTYTAQASQSDSAGDTGQSAPVTFTVSPPAVTLSSPGANPLTTGAVTLTGRAGTAPGDASIVYVGVLAGSTTSGALVRLQSVSVAPDGTFSATISPELPDGQYTAVAAQGSSAGAGSSQPVTFFVKAHPPALSFLVPRRGASVANSRPTLSGFAGVLPGDASRVTVVLFRLDGSDGKSLGRVSVPVKAGRWSLRWPRALPLGLYTAEAEQGDNLGHVSIYVDRFLVVAPPPRRHPHRTPAKRR